MLFQCNYIRKQYGDEVCPFMQFYTHEKSIYVITILVAGMVGKCSQAAQLALDLPPPPQAGPAL